MAFIDTIPPAEATGDTLTMYARQQAKYGYVPNYAKVFCRRSDIMSLWADLLAGIRRHIAPRNFEVATLAAAHAIGNSACALAHGRALMKFLSEEEVIALVSDPDNCGLSQTDKAIARFARKVALDASSVSRTDIDELRQAGLDDAAIFDIAATAAARCFFAKLLDALGVQADRPALELSPRFREAMTVGRPISRQEPEVVMERVPEQGMGSRRDTGVSG